jgi:hypothetical protein
LGCGLTSRQPRFAGRDETGLAAGDHAGRGVGHDGRHCRSWCGPDGRHCRSQAVSGTAARLSAAARLWLRWGTSRAQLVFGTAAGCFSGAVVFLCSESVPYWQRGATENLDCSGETRTAGPATDTRSNATEPRVEPDLLRREARRRDGATAPVVDSRLPPEAQLLGVQSSLRVA